MEQPCIQEFSESDDDVDIQSPIKSVSIDDINLCLNQLTNLIEHKSEDLGVIPELSILCQALYENNSDEYEDSFKNVNHYELAR